MLSRRSRLRPDKPAIDSCGDRVRSFPRSRYHLSRPHRTDTMTVAQWQQRPPHPNMEDAAETRTRGTGGAHEQTTAMKRATRMTRHHRYGNRTRPAMTVTPDGALETDIPVLGATAGTLCGASRAAATARRDTTMRQVHGAITQKTRPSGGSGPTPGRRRS